MDSDKAASDTNPGQQLHSRDRRQRSTSTEAGASGNARISRSVQRVGSQTDSLPALESQPANKLQAQFHVDHLPSEDRSFLTLVEFVQRKFIPEYVSSKRPAGRAHFQAILKHVLTPQQVDRLFQVPVVKPNGKLKELQDWPYMDSYRLCDVNAEIIQRLVAASLKQGYSIQTATHIRNVVRAIFSHASHTSYHTGQNPATTVVLPAMARKEQHFLTLSQLRQLMPMMHYPERLIALFATLTGMTVAEICGLQWRYVNLTYHRGRTEGQLLPPRSVAIRNQRYRGQFVQVTDSRKRFVPIPDSMCTILIDLKNRKEFTGPQDFVLVSRNGTPIHPENIAARRLKSIGRVLEMPWLSWYVFHRTHATLSAEHGKNLYKMFEETILDDTSESPPIEI